MPDEDRAPDVDPPVTTRSALARRWPRPAPIEWLYLVVGLALVARYFWIFDDSFIYFRYVDNLLFLDAGLTFNAGERVEGFSSPAHCMLLAGLRALHLPWPAIVLGLGLASFAVFWYALVALHRASSPDPEPRAVANLPLALCAASYSVTSFFTAGNEGPLLHLAAVANAWLLVRPRSRAAALAVAMSPLVRPELALALLASLAYVWSATRRFPRVLCAAAIAANGGWLAFRAVYYADLLPNTYYLKIGTRLESETNLTAGLRYLTDALAVNRVELALVAVALLAALEIARARSTRGLALAPRAAQLLVAALVAAPVVASGGSAMHYYYLAFPLTLAACATAGIVECALGRFAPFAGALVAALVLARYPASLSRHPLSGMETMARLPALEVMTDPAFFRHQEKLPDQWPSIAELTAFAPRLAAESYTGWSDSIWCNTLYAHYDVRSVHGFGLTDAILARVDTPEAKRGHKSALAALARDLIALQMERGTVGRGVYSEAIASRRAPEWMVANRATIEVVELKIFPPRGVLESLRLALRFPPPIRLL